MMELYLFRHAESEYNALDNKFIGGQSNHLQLSPRGVIQAEALGKRILAEGIKFDEIYSSTANRARKTAEIVCDNIGFPANKIVSSAELLELFQGDWEGKVRAEVQGPKIFAEMKRLHWEFKAPGGESQKEVEKRMYGWVERNLLNRKNLSSVAIFGHGVATKCLLRAIMQSDPKLTYKIEIDNCSITHLRYYHEGQHEGWAVMKINDNTHLREIADLNRNY